MDAKIIWARIQTILTCIGGTLGFFLGGVDGVLTALVVLMAIDYVTGVACAIIDKKLSSTAGFKGLFKKVLILALVGMANVVDTMVLNGGGAIRGMVICFYISNEGVSVIENATRLGLPVPEKLKAILAQLHDTDGDKKEAETDGEDG